MDEKKEMTQAIAVLDKASHLIDSPDAAKRLQAVNEVAAQYNDTSITTAERKLAEQIFRVLMHDAEVNIRKALSENLKETNTVPKDIIMQMVEDVDEVAVPVLEFSEVLTEEDLVEVIKNSDSSAKFMAISNRKEVPEPVSDALVDTGEKGVVKNLLKRASAKISEMTMNKVVEKHSSDGEIMETLTHREELPVSVVEKVIKKVGGTLQGELVQKYGHIIPDISNMVEKSQEAATLKFMGLKSSDSEIKSMVDKMDRTRDIANEIYESDADLTKTVESLGLSGRLTPISALCMGNLELFEIGIARITKIPVANVRKLLKDDSGQGLEALYNRAKLPENIYSAVKLVIKVIRDIDEEAKNKSNVKKTANELITRLLNAADSEKEDVENLSYFISMIHKHARN